MAELTGTSVLVKVPVAATPTALTYEISSTLNVESNFFTAVNKSTSGFASQAPSTRNWSVDVRAHLDDASNPALDVVKNAALAGTLLSGCQLTTGVTGWDFSGNAYAGNLTVEGEAQAHAVVGFRLGGSGALSAS